MTTPALPSRDALLYMLYMQATAEQLTPEVRTVGDWDIRRYVQAKKEAHTWLTQASTVVPS